MISGKQLHYLLPIFPAFALLIGYVLSQPKQFNETIFSRLLPSAFLGLFGFLVITLPIFPFITRKVSWIGEANSEFGIIMVIMSIWVFRRPKKNFNSVMYSIRFHIYPNIKAVKTKGGNSVLISLPNGDGWLLHAAESVFNIEKNIFFGNRNKILNNESVSISGNTSETNMSINWSMERVD